MRILICDDEKTYLNTLQIHVEEYMQSHHILYNMTTLLDATQLPEDEVFDLAFLDIQMPNVDGITLAKRLRQRNPKTMPWISRLSVSLKNLLMSIVCMLGWIKQWSISMAHMLTFTCPKTPLNKG